MLKALQDKKREDGFTLIELMVVVLIIAILVAIAIPTFLGARERAQDKAATSDARNAVTAAKELFVDTEDYSGLTEAALEAVEPSLDFDAAAGFAAVDEDTVSWQSFDYDGDTDTDSIVMVTQSASGDYVCFVDVSVGGGANAGSATGKADALASVDTPDECFAAA